MFIIDYIFIYLIFIQNYFLIQLNTFNIGNHQYLLGVFMKYVTTFITPLFSLFTKNHIFLKEYFFVVILTHKFICSIISSKM